LSELESLKQQKRALIRRHADSRNTIASRQVAATLLPLGLLFWAGILSLAVSPWLTAAVIVLLMFMMVRVFALMHECGHGSLFRSQCLNRSFGFLFGVLSGMPQYVWAQHHDYHHRTNGNWDKYRGPLATLSVDEYEALSHNHQQRYWFARHLALAPFGGFIYLLFNPRFNWIKGSVACIAHVLSGKLRQPSVSLREHVANFKPRYWSSTREYWHMLFNNIVLLSLWYLLIVTAGPLAFFTVYLISVSLAGGIGIALFTVQHNFDSAYASRAEEWDADRGSLEGTSFLVLPGWLNWITANIGYHHIHHLSAAIPGYRLPQCHDEYAHLFGGVRRITLREIPAQLKCLLWDNQAQRIVSSAQYESRPQGSADWSAGSID
jgi:omega-6 fatty acid desaturase (delta-12 desaturase)